MSKHDTDFLTAQTRRLEAAGIVLRSRATVKQPLHPHPRRGRKKIHVSGYDRLKAYRRRKSGIRIKVTDDNEIGL